MLCWREACTNKLLLTKTDRYISTYLAGGKGERGGEEGGVGWGGEVCHQKNITSL